MDRICAVIPALNPDGRLSELLGQLRRAGFSHIVVVDDGSAPECAPLFDAARDEFGCIVLRHGQNLGKGRALKTAFAYLLGSGEEFDGVVTADCDGQHTPQDIAAVARACDGSALVLGCRSFAGRDVPPRSRFGNAVMSGVFRLFCGVNVGDTQTGLRAIPRALLPRLLETRGDGFDYEMNMLLDCSRLGCAIRQVPIRTVYLEGNRSSHFHPLRDSARVCAVFGRFALSSLLSFLADIVLFALLRRFGADIWLATAGARALSSVCNFVLNRRLVFASGAPPQRSLPRYYALCVVQAACSAGLVSLGGWLLRLPEVPLKIVVDTLLFFASYHIQRRWVFSGGQNH